MKSTIPPRNYRPASGSRWLVGSFCLHAMLLLLIVGLLMPAGESEPRVDAAPKRIASAKSVEKLSEKIERLQTQQLWETVESLETTLTEMEQLESEKTKQLHEAFPEQAASAIEDVATDQKAALQAQQRALTAIEKAMRENADTQRDAANDARQAAVEQQVIAENALAEMATAQALAGRPTDTIEEVISLQVTASQLLATAKANDRDARAARQENDRLRNQLKNLRNSIQREEHAVEQLKSELQQRGAEISAAEQKVKANSLKHVEEANAIAEKELKHQEAIAALTEAREQSNKRRGDLQKVQQSGDKPQVIAARKAMMESKQQEKQRQNQQQSALRQVAQQKHKAAIAEHAITVAQHRVDTLKYQTKHLKKRFETARQRLATEQDRARPHEEKIEENLAKIATAPDQNKSKLADAKAAQQRAIAANEVLDLDTDAASDAPAAESTSARSAFARARELERAVSQRFKDIRAAELALIQKMKPSAARKLISVAQPQRSEIDEAALDQDARTQSALKDKIQTMTEANQQAMAMDEFAKSLLAQTRRIQKQAVQISLVDRQADAAEERQKSAQEHGGAVADMTALMGRRSGQKNRADNPQQEKSANSPGADDYDRERFTQVDAPNRPAPPPPANMAGARPARRFGSGGKVAATGAKGWTFVDSWYILGPFDNANRKNIHKQFPPESLIDLDAKYRSSASPDLISWQFYQSSRPMLPPKALLGEYVIYYAWTELYFEQATDVWIAVGSDDRSDLWINDVRVWSSSDVLKAWRIDEGLRRVRFEAGINKILYRIENGNGPWAFSLCINMDDQTKVASQ